MSLKRAELRKLTSLSLPVMGAQLGSMLLGTVDTLMVARVDADSLAAAAIANAWIFGVMLVGQGVIHGMDPLVTQAHGGGRHEEVARTLQKALLVGCLVGAPLAAALAWTEDFLLLVGQDPELARLAHGYARVQAPSIPVYLWFTALRQYLGGREIVRPAMWVMAIANLFNVLANWVLIFGGLGIPALGLLGAGIATSLTRLFSLIALLGLVRWAGLHEGAWVAWQRSVFAWRGLLTIVRLGVPVAVQMSLEIWAFSAATLLAGRLGATDAGAHTIVLNMAALSFMLPLGISQGAVTRVGNLLGAGDPQRAQTAAWVAIAAGAGVMTVSAIAFVTLRWQLPALYTSDPALIALSAAILPIAAAFQIFDGTQVTGCGVLRGMGRTVPAAWLNLLGYWVIGLPLGAWLALERGWGLPGIWWGLCAGLACVAVGLVLRLWMRGPGYVDPPV